MRAARDSNRLVALSYKNVDFESKHVMMMACFFINYLV